MAGLMAFFLRFCVCFAAVFIFAAGLSAQELLFNYSYRVEPAKVSEQPQIGKITVVYPVAARKAPVEGTVKATATLGEDGKVRDIVITNDIGSGVGAAVTAGLEKLYFKPAYYEGSPVAVKLSFEYIVTVVYDEYNANVAKAAITAQPAPIYPEKYRAAALSGKVSLQVLFKATGDVKVYEVTSMLPKDFTDAAKEAAKNIKFTPAMNKRTKQPVSQQLMVEYDFKP